MNPTFRDRYLVFPTPLRPSHKNSFFVFSDGRWEDRGLRDSEGALFRHSGDSVDFLLAAGLATGRREAMRRLLSFRSGPPVSLENSFFDPSRLRSNCPAQFSTSVSILSESRHISNEGLLEFLSGQGITQEVAEHFLCQVSVEQGQFFRAVDDLLAFRTDNGSSLLFSEFETRFSGPAGMTHLSGQNSQECVMFTHVFDLIQLASRGVLFPGDVIVMNHVKFFRAMLEEGSRYFSSRLYMRMSDYSEKEKAIALEYLQSNNIISI